METIQLVTTALALAQPFLQKIGEGTSKKIGEDIWNMIKKPFVDKGENIDHLTQEQLKSQLLEVVSNNPEFKNELEKSVIKAQSKIDQITQSITTNGTIEKQVNIGSNIGNITL